MRLRDLQPRLGSQHTRQVTCDANRGEDVAVPVIHDTEVEARMSSRYIFGLSTRVAELEAERAFLLDRAIRAGSNSTNGRNDISLASNALVAFAFTGSRPDRGRFPHDADDLARCCRTYIKAPSHVQARMRPLLAEFFEAYEAVTGPVARDGLPILSQVRTNITTKAAR